MRIFFATTLHAHWGGSECLWSETALTLVHRGHEIAYFQPWQKEHPSLTALRNAGALEFAPGTPVRWWRRIARHLTRPSLSFPHAALSAFRPDLVIISQSRQDEGLEWHTALTALHLPYVILNELVVEALYVEDTLNERLSAFFQGARRVYCVSQRNLHALEQLLGHALPSAAIQANPFRVPYCAPFHWPADDSALRLALVGRLDPDSKGHRVLFEVLRRPYWQQRQLYLHLFGDGSSARSLRRLAAWWELECVVFEGYVQDVASIWNRCHVAAQPSREEGLPIALVEGMLSGRPAFATSVAGIPEIVDDGETGFLAPGCTADLLDAALQRLWERRADLPSMGRLAQTRVRERLPESPAALFADRLVALARPS